MKATLSAITTLLTEYRIELQNERELVAKHEALADRLETNIAQLEELQEIAEGEDTGLKIKK